jgi:hypothetical protein
MSKRIVITEDEKNRIKSLYNINEQGIGAGAIIPALFSSIFSISDKKSNYGTSSGSVDSKWENVTKKVIDEFEGGYWNPKCGHQTKGMGKSTETMFGLDRYNGNIESTSEGRQFFGLIDQEKKKLGKTEFCKKWKWNYRGGELEEPLKDLASKIMFKSYERNMKNYVKDPETKKRIESNRGLLLHMSYACWNGPAFFRDFAKLLDTAVKEGKTDADLLKIAKDSRTARLSGAWAKATVKVNSLIDQESGLA